MAILRISISHRCTEKLKVLQNPFLFFILSTLVCLTFTKYYFLLTHEYYEPASSERMANFTADKVFQKRILPTLLAKVIVIITGLSLDHTLKGFCVLSCIALLYGFRALLRELSTCTPLGLEFIIFIPVAWNYFALNGIYHSYDIPTMAFFCWGVVLFLRKRFVLFYAIYILAGLNRESTCFITIAIFSLRVRIPEQDNRLCGYLQSIFQNNRLLILHCIVQIIIWFINKF